jgi:hypothetical protein
MRQLKDLQALGQCLSEHIPYLTSHYTLFLYELYYNVFS